MTLLTGTAILLSGCKKDVAEQPSYTVTVTSDGNGSAQADMTATGAGETVTLTAAANEGYKFKRWTVESGSVTLAPNAQTTPATFVMPEGDVSIKAEFMEKVATTYTVTVTDDGNGTAQADKTTAEAGTTVTLTAKPTEGYVFKQWTVESGSVTLAPDAQTNPATFVMPESNVSVKAEFIAYGGPDIETVPIPAGTFLMGEAGVDEPVHTVTLTQNFRMSKYEITNTQYAEFLNIKGVPGTEGSHAYYDGPFIVAECT